MVSFIKFLGTCAFIYISFGSSYSIQTILSDLWNLVIPCILIFLAFLTEIISFFQLDGVFNRTVLRILSIPATLITASFNILLPKLAFIELNHLDELPFKFGIKIQRNWSEEEMMSYLNKILTDVDLPIDTLPQELKLELVQKSNTIQELDKNILELVESLDDKVTLKTGDILPWFVDHYIITGVVIAGLFLVVGCFFYFNKSTPLPDDLLKVSDKMALDVIKAEEAAKSATASAEKAYLSAESSLVASIRTATLSEKLPEAINRKAEEAAKSAAASAERAVQSADAAALAADVRASEAADRAEIAASHAEEFGSDALMKIIMSDHNQLMKLSKITKKLVAKSDAPSEVFDLGPAVVLGISNEEWEALRNLAKGLTRNTER